MSSSYHTSTESEDWVAMPTPTGFQAVPRSEAESRIREMKNQLGLSTLEAEVSSLRTELIATQKTLLKVIEGLR